MGKSQSRPNGGMKTVKCRKDCGHKMEISEDSTAGTCWRCVNKMMAGPAGRLDYVPNDEEFKKIVNSDEDEEDDDDGTIVVPSESWN